MNGICVVLLSLLAVSWAAPSQRDCICSAVYNPVCGTDGEEYSNLCRARCNKVTKYFPGPCNYVEHHLPDQTEGCMCPALFDPVCGADGNTYSSACQATCSRVTRTLPGPCGPTVGHHQGGPVEGCLCPADFRPVCGADGRTYANRCQATCNRVTRTFDGECPPPMVEHHSDDNEGCICPAGYSPVCGADGNTYPTRCHATCSRQTRYTPGACGPQVGHHGRDNQVEHHSGPQVEHHGYQVEHHGGPQVEHHGGYQVEHHGGPQVEHHGGYQVEHFGGPEVGHHGQED